MASIIVIIHSLPNLVTFRLKSMIRVVIIFFRYAGALVKIVLHRLPDIS